MATELKPDLVKMDLSLAEKYIKENQKLWAEPQDAIISGKAETENGYIKLKFLDLAEQINENAVLFSQLEYMRRAVHPNDVLNWDIKLLVQYLAYSASARTVKLEDPTPGRIFTEGTPLANFGFFVLDFRMYPRVEIVCDQKSAPVCTLFTQLCHKVGLETIGLRLLKSNDAVDSGSGVTASCAGVITETADIDSAIDVFLGSTTKYPWTLSLIFVQESVYERFQTAMSSKCEGQHESGEQINNKSFSYKDKTFLIDYLSDYKKIKNTKTNITVEAYRTPKELMSLLKNQRYLSLWCNDISQANEIAFNVDAKAIWINDYALFSGPPESSLVYYKIYLQNNTQRVRNKNVNEDLMVRKLRECFRLFLNSYNTEENRKFIDGALLSLSERNQKVVVDEKGTLCVVDLKPSGTPVTGMNTFNWMYIAQDMLYYIKEGVLIEGVTWDINTQIENVDVGKLFKVMEGKQVPVTFVESGMQSHFIVDFYNPKAVWTTFGTVFAN